MNWPYNRRLINQLTAELGIWLHPTQHERVLDACADRDETTWRMMQLAILMQGVGPYLAQLLPSRPLYAHLPLWLQAWLQEQYTLNALRLQRLRDDLLPLLAAAEQQGMRVMVLKGLALTQQYYSDMALRPMSDIDLLVQPEDLRYFAQLLERRGYNLSVGESSAYSGHLCYRRPEPIRSHTSEHPDNPRPVELHTHLRRSPWHNVVACDQTEYMWELAQPVNVFGGVAWQPPAERLLNYVAMHAAYHFLFAAGRYLHWVDILQIAQQLPSYQPADCVNWTYPPLRLAQRFFEGAFPLDLCETAALVEPKVRMWAEEVPLDGRCGLTIGPNPNSRFKHRFHLERWRPSPWRLRWGYYHLSLPHAYLQHALNYLKRTHAKLQ